MRGRTHGEIAMLRMSCGLAVLVLIVAFGSSAAAQGLSAARDDQIDRLKEYVVDACAYQIHHPPNASRNISYLTRTIRISVHSREPSPVDFREAPQLGVNWWGMFKRRGGCGVVHRPWGWQ